MERGKDLLRLLKENDEELHMELCRATMLTAVELDGLSIKRAWLPELRNDMGVVSAAIQQNPLALQVASPEAKERYTRKLALDFIR